MIFRRKSIHRTVGRSSGPLRLLGAAAALLALATASYAQQVQATLSDESTVVGRPVELTVKVIDGRASQLPPQLNVDGLDARLADQGSFQMEVSNFKSSMTFTYTYRVIPLKSGDFTIPSIPLSVGGKSFKTSPLPLHVGAAGGNSLPPTPGSAAPSVPPPSGRAPSSSAPPSTDDDKLAFGELIVPKKTAYVGEVIPIEIRFYFDARVQSDTVDHPTFSGEGFTVGNFTKRAVRQQQSGDRSYNVYVFKSAITPVKSGTLEIPDASIQCQVILPAPPPDPNDFLGGLLPRGQVKQGVLSTDSTKLEVKNLPAEGKPDDFGGAIGKFSLAATVTPKKAAASDPVSLKVTVSGQGNFDAMTAPTLIDADGWKTYPPAEKFESSTTDPVGYSGRKEYEFMLLAREDQTKTPVAEFSFFDPSISKYVTLKSPALPIDAKGGGVAAAATAPSSDANATTPTPAPSATQTPASTPGPQDSLISQRSTGSFQPFVFNRTFLITNCVLGVIWLGALLVGFSRVVSSSSYARQSAAHRERRKILDRMDSTDTDTRQFLTAAAEFVHARLEALAPVSHLRDSLEAAPLKSETKSAVAAVLDRADELNYAAGAAEAKIGPEERKRIVDLLREFDHELQNVR